MIRLSVGFFVYVILVTGWTTVRQQEAVKPIPERLEKIDIKPNLKLVTKDPGSNSL